MSEEKKFAYSTEVTILVSVIILAGTIFMVGNSIAMSVKSSGVALNALQGTGTGQQQFIAQTTTTTLAQQQQQVVGTPNVEGKPVYGSPNAKVQIVAFDDFECPFCARAHPSISQLLKDYDGKVNVVFKHYPLPFHPNAQKSGEAYECFIEQQPTKGYDFITKMFENQQALDTASLKNYAKSFNVDQAKFDTCLDTGAKAAIVTADMQEGSSLGVQGTPTFFLNGQKIVGAQPYETFKAAVDQLLAA